MAKPEKRVCWDACAWIALIQNEQIRDEQGKLAEDRGQMARAVFEAAKRGRIEIVTSGLSLAEVCKKREIKDADPSRLKDVFEHEFIVVAPLDFQVGEKARELMMAGHFGLKPQDACHLATAAIIPNVTELHTFDGKLLDLDLKIAKADHSPLRICKPHLDTGAEPPLIRAMQAPDEPLAGKPDRTKKA